MKTKYDYDALEREYITSDSDLSVRQLCERHGIKTWSSVNVQKNKRKWDQKREAYRAKLGERKLEGLAQSAVTEAAEIHGELLYAIRAAVRRFVADLSDKDNPQRVSPRDIMGLIDKFLVLEGKAPAGGPERTLNANVFNFGGLLAGAPESLLGELAELARGNGAGAKPVGRGPLVVFEGTSVTKES